MMIDLQPFCSTPEGRVQLSRPWRYDKAYVVASDGRIIIRVPAREYPDVQPNDRAPKSLDFLGWKFEGLEWIPIPEDLGENTAMSCRLCAGSGTHDCSCGTTHECGKCNGSGEITEHATATIGAQIVSCDYLRKIKALPGAMIENKTEEGYDPIAFKFDGGEGYIMGMMKKVAE